MKLDRKDFLLILRGITLIGVAIIVITSCQDRHERRRLREQNNYNSTNIDKIIRVLETQEKIDRALINRP